LRAWACATRRTGAALLGCAGAALILSALSAFAARSAAALAVLALPPLARTGRQLLVGCRSGLGQDERRCGLRWEGRDMHRQQHQGEGGTRKKQAGKLHDPRFINWQINGDRQ
jgi:hypothetical protein